MLQTSKIDIKKHKPISFLENKKDTEAIGSINSSTNLPWYPNMFLTTPDLQPAMISEKDRALLSPVHSGWTQGHPEQVSL